MPQLNLGQQVLDYRLQRSQRKSIGLLIDADGLRVTAPPHLSLTEIEQALRGKQRWILGKLAARQSRAAQPAAFSWQEGAQLPFLGQQLTLHISQGRAQAPFVQDACLHLAFAQAPTPDKIKRRVHTWLQEQAAHHFSTRLQHFSTRMQLHYAGLRLSAARTQWGSCSAQGMIALNWRLIHFGPGLIDYVVVHELAHRAEMNHSARFWAIVEQYFPDYKAARARLKELARSLPAEL